MNGNTFIKVLALFAVGALLGLSSNLIRGEGQGRLPWTIDWSESIEIKAAKAGLKIAPLEDVKAWSSEGSHIILDARPEETYRGGRIPGAMSLPYHHLDEFFPDIQLFLAPDLPVVCYCSGVDCEDKPATGRIFGSAGLHQRLPV